MPDRRPLATRDTKIAARLAQVLAERGVAPNTISQVSIAFAVLAFAAFWLSAHATGALYALCLVLAALGCQLRLLANLLDGMVAVEGGCGAPDGPFWNEAPDRVADVLILVGLGLAAGHAALGWAAGALAIGTAYLRELGSAQGLPADFRGPMAKPHRMALTTGAAILAIFVPSVAGWPVLYLALWLIVIGTAVTIARRSWHLVGHLRTRGP